MHVASTPQDTAGSFAFFLPPFSEEKRAVASLFQLSRCYGCCQSGIDSVSSR